MLWFFFSFLFQRMKADADVHMQPVLQTYMHTNTVAHTSSSLLQPREVMKTNGRVLFPLGPEEELSHQANFILVWPRDSISSGCFYKRRAAPRHRPVMDMRAWWPDGRCWPCNSSSKHSLMTPLTPRAFLTQCDIAALVCLYKLVLSKQTVLLFFLDSRYVYTELLFSVTYVFEPKQTRYKTGAWHMMKFTIKYNFLLCLTSSSTTSYVIKTNLCRYFWKHQH